ncbi:hypothetical protein AgCh_001784 [Apium graveolens]
MILVLQEFESDHDTMLRIVYVMLKDLFDSQSACSDASLALSRSPSFHSLASFPSPSFHSSVSSLSPMIYPMNEIWSPPLYPLVYVHGSNKSK